MTAAERRRGGVIHIAPDASVPTTHTARISGWRRSAGLYGGRSLILIFRFPRCSCVGAKEREGWSGYRELRGGSRGSIIWQWVGGRERKRVRWCVEFDALGYPSNLVDKMEA